MSATGEQRLTRRYDRSHARAHASDAPRIAVLGAQGAQLSLAEAMALALR